jgi:catechol 2,3-dioxygenase-like lactoylglutathione lyase family enzyme
MKQNLAQISIVVNDYDAAIAFYTQKMGFILLEDIPLAAGKRWVKVAPAGSSHCAILLAKAGNEIQEKFIGNQTGGRVFLFLHTDDFWRDYLQYCNNGIHFLREPVLEAFGTVAVFEDLYGNLWELIQPNAQ